MLSSDPITTRIRDLLSLHMKSPEASDVKQLWWAETSLLGLDSYCTLLVGPQVSVTIDACHVQAYLPILNHGSDREFADACLLAYQDAHRWPD